jgi:hypothetical protein
VCCVHNGESADTRGRGGLIANPTGAVSWSCFNCGYKANYMPGRNLTAGFKKLLTWMGADEDSIRRLSLVAFQLTINQDQDQSGTASFVHMPSHTWEAVSLPQSAQPISELLAQACDDANFVNVLQYLESRGSDIADGYQYYWSSSDKHQLCNRVIMPFWHNNKIVGWTARHAAPSVKGINRYWNSSIPPGYLFNQNVLQLPRKWALVCEGPFDAIATQGVAAMGSTLTDLQIQTLTSCGQQPVILPDRQGSNQDLIDVALSFGWRVSFPEWDRDIKDAADACRRYGQIFTITSALAASTDNPIEIGVKRQFLGDK